MQTGFERYSLLIVPYAQDPQWQDAEFHRWQMNKK